MAPRRGFKLQRGCGGGRRRTCCGESLGLCRCHIHQLSEIGLIPYSDVKDKLFQFRAHYGVGFVSFRVQCADEGHGHVESVKRKGAKVVHEEEGLGNRRGFACIWKIVHSDRQPSCF